MRPLLLTLLVSWSLSASVAAADSPMARDIRKFFKLTNVEELSFADIKNNLELQRKANPDVPDSFWKELLSKLKPEEYINRMVPVYEKHFTHDDIKAWIVFFETPHGKAFLQNQPTVLQESSAVTQAYVEEMARPLLEKLQKK